jgi:hypothetical protein
MIHVSNPRHLSCVFAVVTIIELANVVHPDTYQARGVDPVERLAMIHARFLARQILYSLEPTIKLFIPPDLRITISDVFKCVMQKRSRHLGTEVHLPQCSEEDLRYQLEAVLSALSITLDWTEKRRQDDVSWILPDDSVVKLSKPKSRSGRYGTVPFSFYSIRFFKVIC